MAQSRPASSPRPVPRARWRGPLVAGFCFGLGYGVTQRLLALQLPDLVQLRQGFDVREFPGTSLESLRLRFGSDTQEIRGDLEVMELEQQARKREEERKEQERKQKLEEQRLQAEQEAEQARQAQQLETPEEAPLPPEAPRESPPRMPAPAGGDQAPLAPTLPSASEP